MTTIAILGRVVSHGVGRTGRHAAMRCAAALRAALLIGLAMLAAGCGTTARVNYAPEGERIADLPGFPSVRVWGDATISDAAREGFIPTARPGKRVQYLAISGGGSSGAFGAGALVGLTRSGMRPAFGAVTGVSTGALIAPFAFLGPAYDDELEYIYTSGITQHLFERKPLIVGLLGSGLVSQKPLRGLVERYVDGKMLRAVAEEDGKGRRLLIITTDMDAQRPVIWDMGRIAASKQPGALKLFQDVLIASASIPGLLPPVLIGAVSEGRAVEEMHADGGTTAQVFTIPDSVLATDDPNRLPGKRASDLYMLVNYTLIPEFELTKGRTIAIGERGLSTLLKSQTRSSIAATYDFFKQAGVAFHLASIDQIVPYDADDPFNPDYMRTLFKLGYDRAVSGRLWDATPIPDLRAVPSGIDRGPSSLPDGARTASRVPDRHGLH